MRLLILTCIGSAFFCCIGHAKALRGSEPIVQDAKVPIYPMVPRGIGMQGIVKLKVTTDGEKVTEVEILSGYPALARAASENVRTWIFSSHSPKTFFVVYNYILNKKASNRFDNCSVEMGFPTRVVIKASRVVSFDPAKTDK